MNLRDLEYVMTIADMGNMARASEKLHVSQSTLSIQLKKLEQDLGVVIFERSNKRVKATAAGEAVIHSARSIVRESQRLREIAKEYSDPFAGEFRLGVFPTLAPYFLPKAVPLISKQFPKLIPLLIEEKTPVLIEMLKAGKLDAALLALPIDAKDLQTAPLFDDPFLLACHSSHPLAKHKSIGMSELKNETLLLLEDGHCLRNQALQVCYMTHAKENQEFRATSLETLRQMVAANVGITLMPGIAATPTKNLAYIPFHKKDAPARHIGLVWRATTPRKKLIDALAKLLRQ